MRQVLMLLACSVILWGAPCNSPATYTVGAGETYATVTAAINAVKTACSTSNFGSGATQTILIDPGTYVEAATLDPSSLKAQTNARLIIKRSGTTTAGYSDGYWPIISISGGGANCLQLANNLTLQELVFTGCQYAIKTGSSTTGVVISKVLVHDVTGYSAIDLGAATSSTVDHVKVYNAPRGFSGGANAAFAIEASHSTAGNLISNFQTIDTAYVHDGYMTSGSGIQQGAGAALTNCAAATSRYGIQTGNQAGTVRISNCYEVGNKYNGHCEAGTGNCNETRTHGFMYHATNGGEMWTSAGNTGIVAGVTRTSNIAWVNCTAYSSDFNSRLTRLAAVIAQNFNLYLSTGTCVGGAHYRYSSGEINGGQPYTSLAAWKTGTSDGGNALDANSVEGVNPRIVGDVDLLNTTAQVCATAPTSAADPFGTEARILCIWRNYTPTEPRVWFIGEGGTTPGPVDMSKRGPAILGAS